MKKTDTIDSQVTDESMVLYWEKGTSVGGYVIFINGEKAGRTDRTHFTAEGLKPETEYTVRVEAEEETGQKWLACVVKTLKRKKRLDITQAPYYACGDGRTLNTEAIQRALDDCQAEESVYIPAGIFLTGALRLHSNMELFLEEGAVLQGTDQVEDYLPKIHSRFEGKEMECYSSLLNMGELDRSGDYNCRHVVIRGRGTIASGGSVLAKRVIASETLRLKDYLRELGEKLNECEKPETIPGRARPRLINMSNCQNIWISGLTLKNGASWNVHMIYSDTIVTNGCRFDSDGVWNGDGWDPDSSSNCTIFDCEFHTGDDAVAIKSGKNPEGNLIGRPSSQIRIFDCRSAFGHGITIGSEMSGGIEDVAIWDCDMGKSMCGIEIKGTKKRGGYVKNIRVKDCTVSRVSMHSVGYNDDGEGWKMPPVFESCLFENLHIYGEYYGDEQKWIPCDALELSGFDGEGYELRDIVFRNIRLGRPGKSGKQTISMQFIKGVTLEKIDSE